MNVTQLLQALGNGGVDYVLVGGLAVQLHLLDIAALRKIQRGEDPNV